MTRRLVATTADELYAIEGLIHDAYVDPDDIVFDEQAKTLTVSFAQEDEEWEGDEPPWELLRSTRWFVESRVPFYAGSITVHHVTHVEYPPDLDDLHMLVSISYDERRRRVTLNALDSVHASVERLEVTGELTDRVVKNMRRRSYRLLHAESDAPM